MYRALWGALLAVSVMISTVGAQQATTPTTGPRTTVSQKAGPQALHGIIVSVQSDAVVLNVTQGKKTITDTVYTDGETLIKAGGSKVALTNLTVGDDVKVLYTKKDGRMTATSVTVVKSHAGTPKTK